MHVKFWVMGALALLLAGCPNDAAPPPAEPIAEPDDMAVCLQGEPFVDQGEVPIEHVGPADANHLIDLRWEAHDGCERLVIDIGDDEGEPGTSPGQVTAHLLRDLGVVRISLRDVEWVDPDATDDSFDGPLARAAYAVFSPEGRWTYVDVHLGDPAEAHVAVLEDPARVVVDLRPGGPSLPEPATTNDLVVVLTPRPGDSRYPLTVTGYARTFEANVVVRLEHQGEDVYDDFTTATAWADAWGHYEFTIEDGPSGPVTLHVGEHSAKDGTWEGARVELVMNTP